MVITISQIYFNNDVNHAEWGQFCYKFNMFRMVLGRVDIVNST